VRLPSAFDRPLLLLAPALAVLLQCGGKLDPVYTDRAEVLSRVTGPADAMESCPLALRLSSGNDTSSRWDVGGADLGITWENGRGEIAMVFGDTYRLGDTTDPDTRYEDSRHNVIGFTTDRDPTDGITLSRMVEDRPGHATEIIGRTPGVEHEQSVIPTAGIAVGDRNFIFFMSVQKWGGPPGWTTNYSSIAYSDDGGETWTRSDVRWAPTSKFAQTALAVDGPYLYVLGTQTARRGALHVARVLQADVLDLSRYEYFTKSGWQTGDDMNAIPVAPSPMGELSLHKNATTGQWQLTYLNVNRQAIVLRTASELTGPWSSETVLIEQREPTRPGLYGGFQHPWFNDGPDVYLTVARKVPCYDTFLVRIPAPASR
jgi:hypothetical protein